MQIQTNGGILIKNMFNIPTISRDLSQWIYPSGSLAAVQGILGCMMFKLWHTDPYSPRLISALWLQRKPFTSIHAASPLCPDNLPRQLHYSFSGKYLNAWRDHTWTAGQNPESDRHLIQQYWLTKNRQCLFCCLNNTHFLNFDTCFLVQNQESFYTNHWGAN